jgi:hypothetical protein
MRDEYQISRTIYSQGENLAVNTIYGHIVGILPNEEEEIRYIAMVAPDRTNLPATTQIRPLPLEDHDQTLASNFGRPSDLIGMRVRIEYYGSNWESGIARIVPPRERQPVGNLSEVPSRGFRFAVAGGGSI